MLKKHPSPNGGYTEATVAGALDIRLGGINYYFGRQSFRAYMGEAINELNARHIQQTIKINVQCFYFIFNHYVHWLYHNHKISRT